MVAWCPVWRRPFRSSVARRTSPVSPADCTKYMDIENPYSSNQFGPISFDILLTGLVLVLQN